MATRIKRYIAKADPDAPKPKPELGAKLPKWPNATHVHGYWTLDPEGREAVDTHLAERADERDSPSPEEGEEQPEELQRSWQLYRWLIKAKRGSKKSGAKYIARIPIGTKPNGAPKYRYIYSHSGLIKHLKEEHLRKKGTVVDAHGDKKSHIEVHGEHAEKKDHAHVTRHATGEEEAVKPKDLHDEIKGNIRKKAQEVVRKRHAEVVAARKFGSEKQQAAREKDLDDALQSAFGLFGSNWGSEKGDITGAPPREKPEKEAAEPKEPGEAREGGSGGGSGGPGGPGGERKEKEAELPEVEDTWQPRDQETKEFHTEILPELSEEHYPGDDINVFRDEDGNVTGHAFEHQAEAVARILASWEERDGFVLMDTPGRGKTIEALMAIKAHGAERNLVVLPTNGKDNLKAQWTADAYLVGVKTQVGVGDGPGTFLVSYNELYDRKVQLDEFTPDPGFSEEQLDKLASKSGDDRVSARADLVKEWFPKMSRKDALETVAGLQDYAELRPQFKDFDTITFDEAHSMSNPESLRSQAAVELQKQTMGENGGEGKILYMSATPFTTLTDCHYLRGLGWFREGHEFAQWAEDNGATLARKTNPVGDIPFGVRNPDSPVPTAMVSARMHVDGAGVKREDVMGDKGVKMIPEFASHSVEEDHHREMFETADKIGELARAAYSTGHDKPQEVPALGATMTMWSKQAWELVKAGPAIEHAKNELDEGRHVAIYNEYTRHDHGHLGGVPADATEEWHEKNPHGRGVAGMMRRHAEEMRGVNSKGNPLDIKQMSPEQQDKYRAMHDHANQIDELVAGMHTEDVMERMGRELGDHARGDSEGSWHDHVAQLHGNAKDADGNMIGRGRNDLSTQHLAEYQGTKTDPPTRRVVIGSMAKAGTGFSLHDKHGWAARSQINTSLPWNSVGFDQVRRRSHRVGSQSDTRLVQMHGDDAMEKRVASIVHRKLTSMGALMTAEPPVQTSQEMLASFEHGSNLSTSQMAELLHAINVTHAGDDEGVAREIAAQRGISGDEFDRIKDIANSVSDMANDVRSTFSKAVDDLRAGGNPQSEAGQLVRGDQVKMTREDNENKIAVGQMVA